MGETFRSERGMIWYAIYNLLVNVLPKDDLDGQGHGHIEALFSFHVFNNGSMPMM